MKLPGFGQLIGMPGLEPAAVEQGGAFQRKELGLPIAAAGNVGERRKPGWGSGLASL